MMAGLIKVGLAELCKRSHDAAAHERCMQDRVDFVKGQPVFYLIHIIDTLFVQNFTAL